MEITQALEQQCTLKLSSRISENRKHRSQKKNASTYVINLLITCYLTWVSLLAVVEKKESKKIILLVVDQFSENKHKLTYEDDGTMIVRVKNWKGFKQDWGVSSATMKLWIVAIRTYFLKGKLA
jgi:hypothetical protein